LIDDAPAPGSRLWLPIVESVVADLEGRKGRWVVKFPLGSIAELPMTPPTVSTIFELLSPDEVLMEPPSVIRLTNAAGSSTWQGENHRWQSKGIGRSLAVVSLSRSLDESGNNEPFFCELLSEIG
jgi:hypothetical protein